MTSSTRLRGAIIPYLLQQQRFFMDYSFGRDLFTFPNHKGKNTTIIATRGPLKYDHQS